MMIDGLRSRRFSSIQLLSSLIVLAVLFFYLISIVGGGQAPKNVSPMVVMGMLLNGGIAIMCIVADMRGVTIAKAHWYFVLIFLSVAPLAQYVGGFFPWNYSLSADLMIRANGIVSLWCVFFAASYSLTDKRMKAKMQFRVASRPSMELPSSMGYAVILILWGVVVFAYLAGRYGVSNMVGGRVNYGADATGWLDWIFTYALPVVPALGCCHCLLLAKERRGWYFPAALLFSLSLFCVNPIYSSRYSVAGAYLPIVLALLPRRSLSNRTFDAVILIAVVVAFPMMNAFKTMKIDQVTIGYLFNNFAGSYQSIDFDAYSMLARTLQYVDNSGLRLGRQLFASLFYGLPGMASQVDVATGELVSMSQGALYTNLSAPIQAEAYVDFGSIGVVVYAVVLGVTCASIDWGFRVQSDQVAPSFRIIVCFVLASFAMFFMRGALQPVFFRMWTFLLFLGLVYVASRVVRALRTWRFAQ